MARRAIALHVVEKGTKFVNLRCLDESQEIWETGNWAIGDATAASLIGGLIYVHAGQLLPSHIGGEIITFRASDSNTGNRKIFTFRATPSQRGTFAGREGWGNEKKVVWEDGPEQKLVPQAEDDESAFPEGAESYALHRARERDRQIVKRAKMTRIAEVGKLECDVCGFDYSAAYGSHGEGYIEAHHTVPVSSLDGKSKTKISDLALVCANCHRMLHRGPDLLSIEQLKELRSGGA